MLLICPDLSFLQSKNKSVYFQIIVIIIIYQWFYLPKQWFEFHYPHFIGDSPVLMEDFKELLTIFRSREALIVLTLTRLPSELDSIHHQILASNKDLMNTKSTIN